MTLTASSQAGDDGIAIAAEVIEEMLVLASGKSSQVLRYEPYPGGVTLVTDVISWMLHNNPRAFLSNLLLSDLLLNSIFPFIVTRWVLAATIHEKVKISSFPSLSRVGSCRRHLWMDHVAHEHRPASIGIRKFSHTHPFMVTLLLVETACSTQYGREASGGSNPTSGRRELSGSPQRSLVALRAGRGTPSSPYSCTTPT